MDIVITEMNLVARLFQCGILDYFESNELNLYMTDLCYCSKPYQEFYKDKASVNEMISSGKIKILSLNELQMERASKLLIRYKPKFVLKTVSAIIVAQDSNYTLITEDELLRETVKKELAIPSFDKRWLVEYLIEKLNDKKMVENTTIFRLVI